MCEVFPVMQPHGCAMANNGNFDWECDPTKQNWYIRAVDRVLCRTGLAVLIFFGLSE